MSSPTLHLGVDGHRLVCDPTGSSATYLGALLIGWSRLTSRLRVSVFVPAGTRTPDLYSRLDGIEFYQAGRFCDPSISYRSQMFWQQVLIPSLIRNTRPDVYLSPFHLTPMLPFRTTVVTTIHDLCFLAAPYLSTGSLVHRGQILSALVRAKLLICVSETTRRNLITYSGGVAGKTRVVLNGCAFAASDIQSERNLPAGLQPGTYFFWAGFPAPYKNIGLLFSAFEQFQKTSPRRALVVVAPERAHPGLRELARKHRVEDDFTLLNSVGRGVLDLLYRNAIALVFPSWCEGFGYPVLEAASQGCPTIAYSRLPAAEILGDTIKLSETLTAESFAQMMRIQANLSAPEREIQADRLRARAGHLTAERMAKDTLSVLTESVSH